MTGMGGSGTGGIPTTVGTAGSSSGEAGAGGPGAVSGGCECGVGDDRVDARGSRHVAGDGVDRTPEVEACVTGCVSAPARCAPRPSRSRSPCPQHALANGAFPDAQSILTPADRPGQILLVTNFGVIMSVDAGATWLWSCETDGNMFGMLYQLAPPPSTRLFTVADQGLAFSDDATCSWATAGGAPRPGSR